MCAKMLRAADIVVCHMF